MNKLRYAPLMTLALWAACSAPALGLGPAAYPFNDSSAVAINQLPLYRDSSFSTQVAGSFVGWGEVVQVEAQSDLLHEDADQKQKFLWYQVRTKSGERGWVFGGSLALFSRAEGLPERLRPYHLRPCNIGTGFEEAVSWFALIEGRDNFYPEDYRNPLYSEQYLVLTNARGLSSLVYVGGQSTQGSSGVAWLEMRDLTDDGLEDIVLVRQSKNSAQDTEERLLEVHSMLAGRLSSIFEERLTLGGNGYAAQSPILYKWVQMGQGSLRLAWVRHGPCNEYSQPYETDVQDPKKDNCLEYCVETYYWDKLHRRFNLPYGLGKIPLKGRLIHDADLYSDPKNGKSNFMKLPAGTPVTIIREYRYLQVMQPSPRTAFLLYICTDEGRYGYILAYNTDFGTAEHGPMLQQFYQNPPKQMSEWRWEKPMLSYFD